MGISRWPSPEEDLRQAAQIEAARRFDRKTGVIAATASAAALAATVGVTPIAEAPIVEANSANVETQDEES